MEMPATTRVHQLPRNRIDGHSSLLMATDMRQGYHGKAKHSCTPNRWSSLLDWPAWEKASHKNICWVEQCDLCDLWSGHLQLSTQGQKARQKARSRQGKPLKRFSIPETVLTCRRKKWKWVWTVIEKIV